MTSGRTTTLREQQTRLTRELIFKALAEVVLEEGVHAFSVRRVAEKAGLSHRTVYRHFPTRQALLDALGAWSAEENARLGIEDPSTVGALPDHVRRLFKYFDTFEPLVRASVILRVTTGLEPSSRTDRTGKVRRMMDGWLPNLPEDERRRAGLAIRTMMNTVTWHQMRSDYDISGEEAGEAMGFALQLLLKQLERRNTAAATGAPSKDTGQRKERGARLIRAQAQERGTGTPAGSVESQQA